MEEKWEIMVFVQSQSQMDSAPLKCRNSKEKAFLHPYVICPYGSYGLCIPSDHRHTTGGRCVMCHRSGSEPLRMQLPAM